MSLEFINPDIQKNKDRIWVQRPTVEFGVLGMKVQASWQTTPAYTRNPAIIREWYLRNLRGYTADEIDSVSFQQAAIVCDQNVTVTGLTDDYINRGYQTTIKNYSFDGVIVPERQSHDAIEAELDFAIAGGCPEQFGVTYCRPGVVRTPTLTIDQKDIMVRSVTPQGNASDNINVIQMALAQSRYNDYLPYSVGQIEDAASITRDGRIIARDVGQKIFVNDPITAAKAMTILLRRNRNPMRLTYQLMPRDDYAYVKLRPLDTIRITDEYYGIQNQIFLVEQVTIEPDFTVQLQVQVLTADTYSPNLNLPSLDDSADYKFPDINTRPPAPNNLVVTGKPFHTRNLAHHSLIIKLFGTMIHLEQV